MPYIKQEQRIALDNGQYPVTAGELNYVLTSIIISYWSRRGEVQNYQRINDTLGALEGAKLEFYRRIVAPYEDVKMKENGDVYT